MMDIGIIAAVSDNLVIGKDGKIPWKIPGDMKRFRRLTLGHSIVMGRRTYESIGKVLPKRVNIVVSSSEIEGIDVVGSLEEAFDIARMAGSSRAYAMGGTRIYEGALDFANFMEITEVYGEFEGDTFFPEVDWSLWKEIGRDDRDKCSFVSYVRR